MVVAARLRVYCLRNSSRKSTYEYMLHFSIAAAWFPAHFDAIWALCTKRSRIPSAIALSSAAPGTCSIPKRESASSAEDVWTVDKIEAVKASRNNKLQQISNSDRQTFQ